MGAVSSRGNFTVKSSAAGGISSTKNPCARTAGGHTKIMRVKMAMGKRAGRHINPDWTSYLSRRKTQHWKRLPKFEHHQASWIAMDWQGFVRRYHGEKLNLDPGYALDVPIWDGDGKTEIVPMKIPWGWRDDEIQFAFAQDSKSPPERRTTSLKLMAGSRIQEVNNFIRLHGL